MTIPRLYHSGNLQLNAQVELEPQALSHVRVLRLSQGDTVILFNGRGGEYQAQLIELCRQRVVVSIKSHDAREVESPLGLHLGQVISRGDKMDLTIQKAVELGVKFITPLFSERCGVKLEQDRLKKKIEHWQLIATSACEQSGRNLVPKINPVQSLTQWLELAVKLNQQLKIMFSPQAVISIKQLASQFPAQRDVTLLVGPEGGFSMAEIQAAVQHGFYQVSLGPRILRTETAGLVAMGVMQSLWGDL